MGVCNNFSDGDKEVQLYIWGFAGSWDYSPGDAMPVEGIWNERQLRLSPEGYMFQGVLYKPGTFPFVDFWHDLKEPVFPDACFVSSLDPGLWVIIRDGKFEAITDNEEEVFEPIYDEYGDRVKV